MEPFIIWDPDVRAYWIRGPGSQVYNGQSFDYEEALLILRTIKRLIAEDEQMEKELADERQSIQRPV